MQQAVYKVSVPGSIMLLGEHAVLQGYRALACAVNQRIYATLIPTSNDIISIRSNHYDAHQTFINDIQIKAPFKFVLAAIKQFETLLPSGFELNIHAEFAPDVGLGSSAAVTVATVALLKQWLLSKVITPSVNFFQECLTIVHQIQNGLGSGADIAASMWGGIINIKSQPLAVEKLSSELPPLVLVYSGHKTPTPTVVQYVLDLQTKFPKLVNAIFKAIGECSDAANEALLQSDWTELGDILTMQQGLLSALHLCNPTLEKIICELKKDPGILGAKISGSGLGDCIVALGELTRTMTWQDERWEVQGVKLIDIKISERGIIHES